MLLGVTAVNDRAAYRRTTGLFYLRECGADRAQIRQPPAGPVGTLAESVPNRFPSIDLGVHCLGRWPSLAAPHSLPPRSPLQSVSALVTPGQGCPNRILNLPINLGPTQRFAVGWCSCEPRVGAFHYVGTLGFRKNPTQGVRHLVGRCRGVDSLSRIQLTGSLSSVSRWSVMSVF